MIGKTGKNVPSKFNPLLLGILILASFSRASGQATPLKLKDAINIALELHPNSSIAKNNTKIASEKIRESRAAFLPSVSANASSDYNIKLPTTLIRAGSLGPEEVRMKMGSPFNSSASVQADLMVFDQTSRAGLASSKVDKEISDLNVVKENEQLIYNTATAYYEALTYLEKQKLLLENVKQNQQLFDILKLRYEQGVAKKSEFDRARVDLNSVQAELKLNESRYKLALNKLKNAMGISLDEPVSIDDSIRFVAPSPVSQFQELNTPALIDVQIDQKNLQLKELDLKKKQAAFLPTLSLYGKYGANAFGTEFSNAYSKWIDFSSVGVKLSIPIFSGFGKSSQLSQSRISLENEHLMAKLNVDNYKLDYQNAGTELVATYNNLLANKENLELSNEVLNATAIEYQEGSADLTTYLDAQSSNKEAQVDYTTSVLDFLNAQLAFEKANGTLTSYIKNL